MQRLLVGGGSSEGALAAALAGRASWTRARLPCRGSLGSSSPQAPRPHQLEGRCCSAVDSTSPPGHRASVRVAPAAPGRPVPLAARSRTSASLVLDMATRWRRARCCGGLSSRLETRAATRALGALVACRVQGLRRPRSRASHGPRSRALLWTARWSCGPRYKVGCGLSLRPALALRRISAAQSDLGPGQLRGTAR